MPRSLSAASLLALCAVPLLAAGCSTSKKLKTDQMESEIAQQYASQAHQKVKTVDCPNDVPVKKGDTFTCSLVLASGQKKTVKITQLDDKGHVQWSVAGTA